MNQSPGVRHRTPAPHRGLWYVTTDQFRDERSTGVISTVYSIIVGSVIFTKNKSASFTLALVFSELRVIVCVSFGILASLVSFIVVRPIDFNDLFNIKRWKCFGKRTFKLSNGQQTARKT